MTSTPEPSVQPVQHDLQNLLAYVTGPDARSQTASSVEVTLFRRRLAQRLAQRPGPHLQPRVARTDGAEALPQQLISHFPAHTLVLDIIHATAYVWDTANALLGETHPQRVAWVGTYLEALLAGQTDAVITALAAEGKAPPGRGRNGRRCSGPWETTNATGRTCTTTHIWRVVGRSGQE